MQYREFGNLDWKASALGFGCMRFPVIDGDTSRIDEPLATRMLRHAIDQGVNYVDTAYSYHERNSERFLGRALKNGYREKVRLATKLPSWMVENRQDFDRFLNEQLENLQVDFVDFYLLHTLNRSLWDKLCQLGVLEWAERAMADGRFRHLGFSFHDKFPVFKEIVDSYDWTLCQIQYNYMDVDYQAGTQGLQYAADKGLAVVAMEPIRGGRLANRAPPTVQAIWDSAETERSPAEWALSWVWNHPQVSLLLSGMSTFEQVQQNIVTAGQSYPESLTEDELALFALVREQYRILVPIPCTLCQYCLPCPSGVNIPRVFEIYNDAVTYGDWKLARMIYGLMAEDERADNCTECGECLEKCPQQIEIPDWLTKAHQKLSQE